MSIPDYQSVMLPLLTLLSDSNELSLRDMVEKLSMKFSLTDDERKELLASGQPIFDNRVGWARTYLKKAGLVDSPKRGVNKITPRGLDIISKKPTIINVKFLEQFPEFLEFKAIKKKDSGDVVEKPEESSDQTPEETLEYSYQKIRKSVTEELLSKVIKLHPSFFEKLVIDLLVKMGYGGSIKEAGKALGKTGDEGIDGTIKEDKLGLDIIYVQAKRWKPGNVVGRPEIHKFIGALAGQGAKKGIFITTSSFTKDAIEYTPKNETKIVLIDGEQLAQLMMDHDLGVSSVSKYEIKRIDNDYFGEE